MIIAVFVQIWKFTARNNSGAARQENRPQSATAYSSAHYSQAERRQRRSKLTIKMEY